MHTGAIQCEHIGKRYAIGEVEGYRTLRESLMKAAKAPFRHFAGNGKGGKKAAHTVWALRDVGFTVEPGEVVGIIGRNGAGKSTLLKVLSRITEPTCGEARISGRVGSLLEVGTGFHPELTGRENVYLNGAILGMKRAEIARKFDEIVAFAEVERFLDTPVKRFSSGMYMRLAFAVAAHLDTEILLVDEVLAVGDAEFQKKCLGKMNEAARGGRTVLFVSHSMASMQRLCRRGILFERGRIAFDGPMQQAAERYMPAEGVSEYVGHAIESEPSISRATARWDPVKGILLTLEFISPFPLKPPIVGIGINNLDGVVVFGTNSRFEPPPNLPPSLSSGVVHLAIDTSALRADTYTISLWLGEHLKDHCHLADVLTVTVGDREAEAWRPARVWIGSAKLASRWEFEPFGASPQSRTSSGSISG